MSDKLIIGDGTSQELARLEARAAHEAAEVAQGLCPRHHAPMHPVDMEVSTRLAGRCGECEKYWWYDTRDGSIGSAADHDQRTGEWIAPYLAARPRQPGA